MESTTLEKNLAACSREANLLGEIVGQQVEQILVPLLVQQRLVEELGVGIALSGLGDGEVEVQRCSMSVFRVFGIGIGKTYFRSARSADNRTRPRRPRSS